jgi:NAD(P)-dependent dehydrogenase (short-subunit alcohol dehydrogenase family)
MPSHVKGAGSQRGRGAIVNMSSVAALQGLPGAPDYSAAKGALIGFTKSLAREVIGSAIRVNAIAPGWIRTPMVTEEIDPRLIPILLARVPAGGMGAGAHRGTRAASVLGRGLLHDRPGREPQRRPVYIADRRQGELALVPLNEEGPPIAGPPIERW